MQQFSVDICSGVFCVLKGPAIVCACLVTFNNEDFKKGQGGVLTTSVTQNE